jgi:succinate dehydrogenase/fumarate reductase iron-sulfur protein
MNITVYKYDPATDVEPYTVSGEVPYKEKMTALEALVYFNENVESVNLDYNCACRMCGRCALMLDGVPCLACVMPITDADHSFEPLAGLPVIRDLIVDKSALDTQMTQIFQRVRIEPFTEETLTPKEYDPSVKAPLYAMEFCARCGVCNASCPAKMTFSDEYVGPTVMLAVAYRHLDPLDQGDRVMEAVSEGLYRCIMCGKCDEVCPQQDIEHLQTWTMLRAEAEERGIKPSYA